MNRTPLTAWHEAHHAQMTDFNGWQMPLYYRGITEEHHHTRKAAGLFDLCHMGRIWVLGERAREFVDYVTPVALKTAQVGDVLYSFLLDANGCPIDDITVYVEREWLMLVVNAGNRERCFEWLTRQAAKFGKVSVEDRSISWGMIALQGPKAQATMRRLFSGSFEPLDYYKFRHEHAAALPYDMIISATGYTGEAGYEMYVPADHLVGLWSLMFSAEDADEVWPIGLGARDSLRLEAGMPLYGHELDDCHTPVAAALGKFIDWDKDFIGRDALLHEKEAGGPAEKLVGFEALQRGPIARAGHEVFSSAGERIGKVTSGIFSPTLQKTIGLAYVAPQHAKIGEEVQLEIRGRRLPATIVKKQFYKRSS